MTDTAPKPAAPKTAPPRKGLPVVARVMDARVGNAYVDGRRIGTILGIDRDYFSRRNLTHVVFEVKFPREKNPEKFRHEIVSTFDTLLVTEP